MASIEYWEGQVRSLTEKVVSTGRTFHVAEREARGSEPHNQHARKQLPALKHAYYLAMNELDAAKNELKRAKAAANR